MEISLVRWHQTLDSIDAKDAELAALRARLREAEALIGSDANAWPDRYRAYRAKYPEARDEV